MSWGVRTRMRLGALQLDVVLEGDDTPLALVGPNGSGKTTLLRMIAGAHRPEEGQIRLGDCTVFDAEAGIDLPPEARRVGYVPQGYGLFPHLSALDNVAFGWIGEGRAREDRRTSALALLEGMGGAHLADRPVVALSGGEQQRIALARALAVDPLILLLDEPLAALDAPARRRVRAYLFDHLRDREGPAVVVTHDARDARALGGRVAVMEGGRIVQVGPIKEVAAAPASEFAAAFWEG